MVNTLIALYTFITGFLLLLPYGICYLRICYITPFFDYIFALQNVMLAIV